MTDPVSAFRRASDVVAAESPGPDDVLRALSELKALRVDLDRVERELISTAREHAIGWPEIANALGLGSRQAAEQRWMRLQGVASRDPTLVRQSHREQRTGDKSAGPELAELRRAAIRAHRLIEADHEWDHRHRRAALVRASLAAAVTAAPSALFALCDNASSDIDAMRVVRLPPALAAVTLRLRQATEAARRPKENPEP
jgi:hypothetical protein